MLVVLLLCDCVCSLKLTRSHPHTLTTTHTQRDGADDLVWSRLDSPLLPPLHERGLTRMIVSDILKTPTIITSTVHMYIHSGVCVESGRSNTHAQLTLPSPFSLPPSLPPSLPLSFTGSICISWKASHRGTNVTRIDLHSSAVGETH